MRLVIANMVLSAVLLPLPSLADDNLHQCLDGRYPALCDHNKLTSAQRGLAETAERKANIKTCLDGRYPALCNHSLLSSDDWALVQRAEYRENLKVCLTGKYSALCYHDWLTDTQREQVQIAEKRENLQICLSGKFQALCRHELLSAETEEWVPATRVAKNDKGERMAEIDGQWVPASKVAKNAEGKYLVQKQPDEAALAAKAERNHPTQSARARKPYRAVGGTSGCESGHWIDAVMNDGEIIKLEDGSLWEVDATDTIDSALWLPVTDVVVCDDKIINTDDNETVGVTRLR